MFGLEKLDNVALELGEIRKELRNISNEIRKPEPRPRKHVIVTHNGVDSSFMATHWETDYDQLRIFGNEGLIGQFARFDSIKVDPTVI
jgi:hypothetical protein